MILNISKMISENLLRLIPREVVDMIADYHDYEKHSRPQHSNNYRLVMGDIVNMSQFQCDEQNMSPHIAYNCWGVNSNVVSDEEYWELFDEDELDDGSLYSATDDQGSVS
jgi:hypothetical protein